MFARTTVLGALALLLGACQGDKKSEGASAGVGESESASEGESEGEGAGVGASESESESTGTGTGTGTRTGAGTGMGAGDAERIATYLAAVERACESGVESSCWFQGIVYARGLLGQKADKAKARQYFDKGCNADLGGPSCPEVLAGKKRLTKKEKAAMEAACARGRVDACRLWGGDKADFHMCNAGVLDACRKIKSPDADIPAAEPVAPKLPDSAGPIAREAAKACDARSSLGCARLARAYLDGLHGLPADPKRAFELGSRSCKREGVSLGCYPAAAARLKMAETAKDETWALGIARTGCVQGDMKACTIIARALERSAELDSRQRGLSFWLMACHLDPDQPEACASFERAVPGAVK